MEISELKDIVRAGMIETLAELEVDKTDQPMESRLIRVALDTAQLETNPKKFGFQFRQVIVHDASDSSVSVNFKPSREESNDAINLKLNGGYRKSKLNPEGFFHWDAVSGGWVDLLFIVTGEYTSGRNLSVNGGGVSLNDGSAIANQALVTLSAATATIIAAGNLNRKVSYITNHTGADLWFGDSSCTNSNKYRKVAAGGEIEYRNTAALYGYSVAGGDIAEELNT